MAIGFALNRDIATLYPSHKKENIVVCRRLHFAKQIGGDQLNGC